jgi:hypothetical protein
LASKPALSCSSLSLPRETNISPMRPETTPSPLIPKQRCRAAREPDGRILPP